MPSTRCCAFGPVASSASPRSGHERAAAMTPTVVSNVWPTGWRVRQPRARELAHPRAPRGIPASDRVLRGDGRSLEQAPRRGDPAPVAPGDRLRAGRLPLEVAGDGPAGRRQAGRVTISAPAG